MPTDDDECPHCGAETATHLTCDNCYRDGCPECMPGGPGVWCDDCEEAAEAEEETERCHETPMT